MSGLMNILWIVLGGFFVSLGYILGGLLMCITIIGIPFGLQAIRIGIAALTPFGEKVEVKNRGQGGLAGIFNIIWLVLFGWEIALAHLFSALLLAITIVGLPLARQHLKLIPIALLPFSYELRT
jgi:uncharacterized membrane protein YccF (DUF307 family)